VGLLQVWSCTIIFFYMVYVNQVISRKQMGLLNKMWEMSPCPN
ncbi:unnamed protein product, partial [Brassica rapa subsp. trilocularis]